MIQQQLCIRSLSLLFGAIQKIGLFANGHRQVIQRRDRLSTAAHAGRINDAGLVFVFLGVLFVSWLPPLLSHTSTIQGLFFI